MSKVSLTITIDEKVLSDLDAFLLKSGRGNRSKYISELVRMTLSFFNKMALKPTYKNKG